MSVEISEQLPATLNPEQENIIQMKKIAELTIEPGVMRLPVKAVASAENSPKWAIDLEHPIEGELRFFREKPIHGWHEDQEFVKLLHWYGIYDENPYRLQTEFLYVRYTEEESPNYHGWELINPNYQEVEKPSYRERAAKRIYKPIKRIRGALPKRDPILMWATILFGVLLSLVVVPIPDPVGVMMTVTFAYLIASIIALILFAPPIED